MESNQCRVFLSSIAYLLVCALRSLGLEGTPWANLQTSSIRTKLLKIGALVCVSTRRVWLKMASSYPYQSLFREIVQRIRAP
jgi:apolipoprotein N-acyltransferase